MDGKKKELDRNLLPDNFIFINTRNKSYSRFLKVFLT